MKNKIIYLFVILLCYCTKEHKTYNVNGVVISINESERSIIVDHDSIPGFMMPMVMPFNLKYIEAVKGINPNDSINFKFKITEDYSYAYDFVVVGKRSKEIDEDDFWDDDEYKKKEIGEEISNITLINLDGNPVELDQYRDKYVFVSFIFTRCPVPNMCPAVVIKNGVLARRFKEADKIKFIMISFDYVYDTPEILTSRYNDAISNFPNWTVWSSVGKISDLYTLSSEIGCEYWGIEKNNIGHNLRSALIGPGRKLLNTWEGDDWLASSVGKEIENYIEVLK